MSKEMTLREFATLGGKASVKSRFAGKTKKQISEIMGKIKKGKFKKNGKKK